MTFLPPSFTDQCSPNFKMADYPKKKKTTKDDRVLFFVFTFVLTFCKPAWAVPGQEIYCDSIDVRNSVSNLRKLENCTVIEGFLKILLIDRGKPKDYEDLSFPKLKEINGYLLLYRAFGLQSVGKLFPNLAVIRGNILFHNYAFVVYEMYQLQELGFPMLTDIVRGSVRIEKNPSLCYVDTIDWDRIAKAGRGGHFFKGNKKWDECPNTCPENPPCPVVTRERGKTVQQCWNSNHCQKVCPDECDHYNFTCANHNLQCCHQECLGSCTEASSTDCAACRHVTFEGRCLKICPPNTYEYLNHRCVQEAECKSFSNNYATWKPFNGHCIDECPSGYTESKSNKHTCDLCLDECPKTCPGRSVNSVATAQMLHGCTVINGSLEIEIKGGHNIIKELEENLSKIKIITGYLKIARTVPLITIGFLQELSEIQGYGLDKKHYALLVLDNPNLQELWDWERRKTKLKIQRGKVFFHFNAKLCLSKIMDLKRYADVMDWDDRDVSPSSNGDRVACDVTNMNVSVPMIGARSANIQWQSFKANLHDDRSLLGYVVYYREAPYANVTIYEGRDACGADPWKVKDVETTDGSDIITYTILDLKPFRQYALYIRTYTTASGRQGAQSPIIYFRTKPDTPSPPVNIKAHAGISGQIVISWSPPKMPNGNVTHYVVHGTKENESLYFHYQRNYCAEPISIVKKFEDVMVSTKSVDYSFNASTTISPGENGECCPCERAKSSLEDEEDDAEFQIHFEDFLHNQIYVKNPNATSKNRQKRYANDLPKTESTIILEHDTQMSTSVVDQTSVLVPLTEDGDFPAKGPVLQFRRSVYREDFVVISNLMHFMRYAIEIQACQDASELGNLHCSTKEITIVRTEALAGADDIKASSVTVQTTNVTAKSGFAHWEEPVDPNGVIVAYHLEYRKQNIENYKPVQICITRDAYLSSNGYIFKGFSPGNYSLRIRAVSSSSPGNWTNAVYFVIPATSEEWSSEQYISIIIATICVCLIIGGITFTVHRKYFVRAPENIIYASVNPEYMSSGLVYAPDEWEVPRDKIKLLKELGQGSFGMVYEGEVKDFNGRSLITPCAAKTVNESASLRERIEFLQEASVMKAFNCHHVIKLLGVVSKGHPTLVIMELMVNGDLKSYLRSHRPGSEENPGHEPPTLQRMLQMASEISDGMAYLAAKKYVHRDLAARNCMVAEDLTVKIGDFGMTRDIYETDYYRKGGKGLLPVRWMSPESLKDGIFDCQSDIWSYGIVLWEMATLASQPYQGLSNEQVLKYVISGGRMDKPEGCHQKLYDIMVMCWDKNPKARPTFIEIIEILLRDVNPQFSRVSFYHSRQLEIHDLDLEAALPSTPLRSNAPAAMSAGDDINNWDEFQFFPSVTKLPSECVESFAKNDETTTNTNADFAEARVADGCTEPHSNNSSKAFSMNYSDGSKGSKVSNLSNGSVVNGHVARTSQC